MTGALHSDCESIAFCSQWELGQKWEQDESLCRSCLFSVTSLSSLRVPQLAPAPLYDTIRIATKNPQQILTPTL